MSPRTLLRPFALIALIVGCDGSIDVPAVKPIGLDPAAESACTGAIEPGPAPIRRLTRQEYNRTVRDLAGDATNPAAEFGAEEESLGFSNNATALVTSSALAEKYLTAAEGIATRLSSKLSRVRGYDCAPASQGEDVCAGKFIEAFGLRVFRRPLSNDEKQSFMGLFAQGRSLGAIDSNGRPLDPFIAGIQLVIVAALQSPEFLYRVELGKVSASVSDKAVPVTDFEMASRLSYLLWGTMPDEALLTTASQGRLGTPDEIGREAKRLLEAPQARETVREFHRQWLDFDRIHNVSKAQSVYPKWNASLPDLMEQETAGFVEHVVFDGEGTWDALLTAPYSMLNPTLAAFYGVPMAGGSQFQKVDAPQRSGLLTQGALLTINAHSNQTSPVHRGKVIREAFLCDTLSPPPKDVVINVPEPQAAATARERFAQHSSNPTCSGCHTLMDPLGFPFEKFDGTGVYRTTENGHPIDDSGEVNASDVPGAFNGVAGLASKLTASPKARGCYVKQWFRFASGRGETARDACSLERLNTQFAGSGRNIKQLLLSLTQTDAFRYRPTVTATVTP